METAKLKKFARFARRSLIEQVSAKLALVLAEQSTARRESPEAVARLEKEIKRYSKEQVIERVAYTWFNRFCALRFMDVKRYNRIGMVSSAKGQFQPEMLAEAKMGHIDEEIVPEKRRRDIFALLDGKAPSPDPQGEVYRLLLVASCNFWHRAMPFLFERIDDYTELLIPDDLLSGNSILAYIREAMAPDTCEDVEVIGWLYQFYISEKKNEVFAGLRKNQKITPENIPAATQLFTPHWIVRYLVENSLGRLWMLNRPNSKLVERMDYYIKPEQAETDFLRIAKPEEIKICDPACGSGHMLTYAFDLLYAIYEEEGYDTAEIPQKILTHNLYGIEIDERAGELAAFALAMKGRAKQRRFFTRGIKPNICVLEKICFDGDELKNYMDFVGRDLFTVPLQTTLRQFEEADNFGSLIRPEVTDVGELLRVLKAKNVSGQLFLGTAHEKVLQALRQADYLSPKYHVVIANPPYMGSRNMNGRLAMWLKNNYLAVKSDLFSAFIIRNAEFALPKGQLGFMSPFVWMFISNYEKLREYFINQKTITSLVQLEYSGFDGATVPICTFTIENAHHPNFKGGYVRLSDFRGSENQRPRTLEAINNPGCGWFYRASAADFKKIPGKPIVYWISSQLLSTFSNIRGRPISDMISLKAGLSTGNNAVFQRHWHEVGNNRMNTRATDAIDAQKSECRWFPCHSGGSYRKWYGNHSIVVNWEMNGVQIRSFKGSAIRNEDFYFKNGITWSKISSGTFAVRYRPIGFLFDDTGRCGFNNNPTKINVILSFFCSCLSDTYLNILCPTLSFTNNEIAKIPYIPPPIGSVGTLVDKSISIAKKDWDSYERSWDFTALPLLNPAYTQLTLEAAYHKLRDHWQEMTLEMQRLEEENNRIFIDTYGLRDELKPDVDPDEITLTCNPHYRYSDDKSEEELERLLLADTMRELVSYAVGCMFGRYALEKPGLILANQGETFEDYLKQVPKPGFPADDDNVIPMLDGDWFADDIAERFRKFLRVAFGETHYEENLRFVEQALNVKGRRNYSIRTYFLGEFYKDHVKRYKKRPIYWLFSSPKGSFNALIYMHRYRPDTVSVVLNDYLREFRAKLASRKNHLEAVSISANASQSEKTKALKEIENIARIIAEMEEYERDLLYPLATRQVEIDLDDGVKVNYPRFGAALKKIAGLSA